ncbi:MAG TPA: hypothetical protein VMS37_19415 [Verrucomicrobiae bacterium]|nr:hypothetical protein [Verrucomicrobiae bacterium]
MKFQHSSLALMLAVMVCTLPAQEKPLRFSGEVKAGQDFRKPIGRGVVFVLKGDEDGWIIEVEPEAGRGQGCTNYSTVIATPVRGYTANDLNVSYGVAAAEAVKRSPREVEFVLDGDACKREFERLNRLSWPGSYPAAEVQEAQDKFGSSAGGRAVLRIVQSKVSPSGELVEGKDLGKIDWIRFEVEIAFPRR